MRAEVIIIGYGPVALITAIILAKHNISACLLKNNTHFSATPSAARLLALSLSSVDLFEKYQLAANLKNLGQPIKKIKVEQYNNENTLIFDPQEIERDSFGYMIDERKLWRLLHNDLQALDHISTIEMTTLQSVQQKPHGICIAFDKEEITSELLIIADGKHSVARKKCLFTTQITPYKQIAMVCDIRHSQNHNGTAYELFMPTGPFATLPKLGGFESSIVWTEPESSYHFLKSLNINELSHLINERCCKSLGKIEVIGNPSIWPLSLMQTKQTIVERVALVGDALHSIHPLAGQGLNLGLRDVQTLTQYIIDDKALGIDLGNNTLLTKYANQRRNDIANLVYVTSLINQIYSSDSKIKSLIGNAALQIVEQCHPLKNLFIKNAVGYGV